jgi:hypothetical protein
MNEGKAKKSGCTFVCNALGYGSAIGGQEDEMKDYIQQAISLLFGDWLHTVSWGKVRILFVETRKRKCRQKCRPNETSQPTTIQPTKPTNQSKNKNFVGPGWGAKNLLKRRQVRKPFSSRPNLSCVRPSAGFSGGYLHRVLQRKN